MSVHIIVDGYNVIRQSPVIGPLDRQDLQLGREALVDKLAAYKRLKGHKITVVFDGTGEAVLFENRDHEKGILIKFSRHGETADSVIKRMVTREKQRALVVSSDREVADSSASQGAATISAVEFEEKMEMAAFMDLKGISPESGVDDGWVPTTKKKGPSKRLPKKKRLNKKRLKKL
ncbi:MAG: NYN domain-containing protein [Desulfobacteraceae bacterium]|nr:NYN domain-containing protein [Desulfobacteraceae bacterium]MBC2755552.1 NYN domain-containing protein [Desulfobacteraceae bacterium]